jgi:hypothetical protein
MLQVVSKGIMPMFVAACVTDQELFVDSCDKNSCSTVRIVRCILSGFAILLLPAFILDRHDTKRIHL